MPAWGAHPHRNTLQTPQPSTTHGSAPSLEPLPDLSHAVPAKDLGRLPSTAEQYRALKNELGKEEPAVQSAKAKSDALRAATELLRQKLIETAAHVQDLEAEKIGLDADIASLTAQEKMLSASFAKDRVSVAHLLAVIERLQNDMPPAMVLRPDDALAAARGAMLVGASLPEMYGAAAALARRIKVLKDTRANLLAKKGEAVANAQHLAAARLKLDQLLASREVQSEAAESAYGDLKKRLDQVAARATDLKTLLARVSALRTAPSSQDVTVVTVSSAHAGHEALVKPVIGTILPHAGDMGGPGLSFGTAPLAQVVAPADAKVLFSGPYHKYGHVLILQTAHAYDIVLAGLGRVDVHPEDQVLAGEPVGTMPGAGQPSRLYFELRQDGRGIDPAPFLTLDLRKAKRT